MLHHVFEENPAGYDTAILIKTLGMVKTGLIEYYVNPLKQHGVATDSLIAFDLKYLNKKAPAKLIEACLDDLLPVLKEQGVTTLIVADTPYFKKLSGIRSGVDKLLGTPTECKYKDYKFTLFYVPNYQGIFFTPALQPKLDLALSQCASHLLGSYVPLGNDIIRSATYLTELSTADEYRELFNNLLEHPYLTCDVETTGLYFYKDTLLSICFTWTEHDGVAMLLTPEHFPLLRQFFEQYTGTLIYHIASFDLKILVYNLFMQDMNDEVGKIDGINVMTKNFHDTKIIAYLALNTVADIELGLKPLSHEFTGDYAEDMTNNAALPTDRLLEYNLKDGLATFYVFNKYYPKMLADQQQSVYQEIMLPSVKVLLQAELTGLPVNKQRVGYARHVIEADVIKYNAILSNHPAVAEAEYQLQRKAMIAKNATLKVKVKTIEEFEHLKFNPGSGDQLAVLLHDVLELPVLDKTKTGKPATGKDVLKKLLNHTTNDSDYELLATLNELANADKMLSTFIKVLENAVQKPDGHYYIFGNFNIGGTVSGRLSSSDPNLQNLPSNPKKNQYTKLIKSCFVAPKGWLFVGADFWSLEDRISALTTRDPMKLKVYTDGFDGHCLRAFYYYREDMPDIEETVASINSIEQLYPDLRTDSKAPTFTLTYMGTYHSLMNDLGMEKEKALAVEQNYHELYKVSDEWVAAKLKQAEKDGYVTVAFGLRLRTPLLHSCFMDSDRTLYQAKAEGRSAGNALGQSYGMLNNRAGSELQARVLASEFATSILPIAHIHDAQYFLIRDDQAVIGYLNKHLLECMAWQELPEIQHDSVKLGGNLSLFHPTWAEETTIPEGLTGQQIATFIQEKLKNS